MGRKLALATSLVLGLSVAGAASATQIDFYNNSGVNAVLSSPTTFGGADGITAWGFSFTGTANDFQNITNWNMEDLYQRNSPPYTLNEAGLGVVGGGSTEINTTEFIKLDFLGSEFFNQTITLGIASLQNNESVQFWLGNPNHETATKIGTLTGPQTNDIGYFAFDGSALNGGANNLYVVGANKDVLLHSVTAVPEPSSLMLMGLGILGIGATLSRKRSKA